MFAFDVAAEIESLLAGPPDPLSFRALCTIVDRGGDRSADLIERCTEALASWPDEVRAAPWSWLAALDSGVMTPTWALVRSLAVEPGHIGTGELELPDPRRHPQLRHVTQLDLGYLRVERLRSLAETMGAWPQLRVLRHRGAWEHDAPVYEALAGQSALARLDELHLADLRDDLFHSQPPPFRPPAGEPWRLWRTTLRTPDLVHLVRHGLVPDLRAADVLVVDRTEARELAAALGDLAHLEHLGVAFRCGHDGRAPWSEPGFGNAIAEDEQACRDLFAAARLANLRSLTVVGTPMGRGREGLGGRGVEAIVASGVLAQLTALRLELLPLGDGPVGEVLGHLDPARIESLSLIDLFLKDDTAAAIASRGALPHLRDLDLSRNRIGPAGAARLAADVAMPALERLHLGGGGGQPYYAPIEIQPVGDAGAVAWAASPNARRLRTLNLSATGLGPNGAIALMTSGELGHLADLDLSFNPMGTWPPELRDAIRWSTITTLNLDDCALGDDDLEALTAGDAPALRRLSLAYNSFGARGAGALARWAATPRLWRLHLHDNVIGDEGLAALAGARSCQRLVELDLEQDCWNLQHLDFGPEVGPVLTDPASFPTLDSLFLGLIDEYHGARYTSGLPAGLAEGLPPALAATFTHLRVDSDDDDEPTELTPEQEQRRVDRDFRTHRASTYASYREQAAGDGLEPLGTSQQVPYGG